MEKVIYDTKEKQREREKDFVLSPKRIAVIETLTKEIVDDICERLETEKYNGFYWGNHTLHIDFDNYYTAEYSTMSDSVELWICNGKTSLRFYDNTYFGDVLPDDCRDRLWDVINTVKQAQKARLTYKDYIKKQNEAKVQAEIKKADEIAAAKAVLEKYNA